MKYIRTKGLGFYLFPSLITHKDFVLLTGIDRNDIISAGFIRNGQCCDRSVSLGIAAGDCDTEDLREQMGMEASI